MERKVKVAAKMTFHKKDQLMNKKKNAKPFKIYGA